MAFVSLPRLPDLEDCEVIGVPFLLQNLEAHRSRLLAAVGRIFPQQSRGFCHQGPAPYVNMSDHAKALSLWNGRAGLAADPAGREQSKYEEDPTHTIPSSSIRRLCVD